MKKLIAALIGYVLSLLLLQWFIIATREPVVLCDGGEGQEPKGYKRARGVIKWKPNDESAVDMIRRLRGDL